MNPACRQAGILGEEGESEVEGASEGGSVNEGFSLTMVGVEGFEPPHGGSKGLCLTAWRHPSKERDARSVA